MKKKILSLMVFGTLLIAATPKVSNAACVTVKLSCYSGYVSCGSTTEQIVKNALEAESAICD
ncbi:hypothetical protein DWB61_13270 [Ancylomarina euxinus]|uniref:Uncharacterized protein n=1 Tax=Ancylomarina euxinus TaxID=2283627 RepID=A0A425XYV1_9BACT|nr:hypothetical protein [Ancylomarina euxinus]MCZ4695626.1 hypothetical protein [Ancylomarina euxinus]MUP16070.1 hypothetical protein [Ancylomarina euxinus]RRG20314.1 hypothetical protein DWB61_13270 [Ancylomarina euxinus]